MAQEFTTIVTLLDIVPSLDGLSNVVKRVHWKVFSFDINNRYYEKVGTYNCDAPSGDFTAYENLNSDTVLGWVGTEVNFEVIKGQISADIDAINNPTINIPLPWDQV